MLGRRRPPHTIGKLPDDIRPGDYWQILVAADGPPMQVQNPTNLTGTVWGVVPPEGTADDWMLGRLEVHTVREHEDGTISVRPGDGSSNSILISGAGSRSWHGYIEHGVWTPC